MDERFDGIEQKNTIEKDRRNIVIMYDPMSGHIFRSNADALNRVCKKIANRTFNQSYLESLDVWDAMK